MIILKSKQLVSCIDLKGIITKNIVFGLLVSIALFFLFPLVFIIINSFMTEQDILANYSMLSSQGVDSNILYSDRMYANLKFIPDMVTIEQYYTVLIKKTKYLFMFWNSVFLTAPIVIGQIIVASMAAYAFSKIDFKFREALFFIYIITMLMPFQVTLVPNYIICYKLGIIGSFSSVVMPGIFGSFGVFLLRQVMVYVPDKYMEAARMDGAEHPRIFLNIVLPMSKSGIAALAILLIIDNWNMVEQPLIFLKDINKYPLSIYLADINENEIGIAFSSSVLYMTPMLLIFIFGENYLVEGIQFSGIKG